MVELMFWHNFNKNIDGLVCSICDSKTWKHVDNTWCEFVTKSWNIRLGATFDGVNSYADLLTNHSMWLVLFLNYNLLP